MKMPLYEGVLQYNKCFEKHQEERAWSLYASNYPNYTKENFVPFSEFLRRMTMPISKRPAEEILAEAEEIRRKLGKG
jgi:hypothetical protein